MGTVVLVCSLGARELIVAVLEIALSQNRYCDSLYKRERVGVAGKKPHALHISIHLVLVISLVLCVAFLLGIWPNYD